MEKIKQGSYKIKRKFGKSIVDENDKQVAWIDDYVLAKKVCMFLNKQRAISLYPEYVRIGNSCYRLSGSVYYSDKLDLSVDFTVAGDMLYSVSNNSLYDSILIKRCSKESWELDCR